MPLFRAYRDFLDYSIDSVSSELASQPASNVKIPWKQFRLWKTANITQDHWIILDFGAAKQVKSLELLNVNYGSFKIQGNSTNNFTSPAYDSGLLTIQTDPSRERAYSSQNPQDFTGFNYQFMRIFIPQQATLNGDDKFSTGGIVCTDQETSLSRDPSWGISLTPQRALEETQMRSGAYEIRHTGERVYDISFRMQRDRKPTDFDEVSRLILTIDNDTPVIFVADTEFMIEKTGNTPFVWICKRIGSPTYQINTVPVAELQNVVLREQH